MNNEKLVMHEHWMFENVLFEKLEYLIDFLISYFKENKNEKMVFCKLIITKNLELQNGEIVKSETENRDISIKRNGEIIYL